MANRLPVERLSYENLRERATAFLRKYHPAGTIPVPIEEIIDCQFEINVIPVPGLRRSFDAEAFVTSDMEDIYVDEYTYMNVPNRFRFSLAHEIGHAFLHQKIYRALSFDDIQSWITAQKQIDEEDLKWLEWQAHAFAGLVLVPLEPLAELYEAAWNRAKRATPGVDQDSPEIMHILAGSIARDFDVSTQVIERRITYERNRKTI